MTDRSVKVLLKGDISDFNRAMLAASAQARAFTKELDSGNDRMTNLVQTGLALGPALVPISATAIPAVAGLTNQLAFATAGAGAAVLAFAGVGDALKALNDFQLDPTATNLEKVNEAMAKLGPAGREFVQYLQELRPQLQDLQDVAQAGLFPGLTAGLDDVMSRLPRFESIIFSLTDAFGDLAAEAGESLASDEWTEFFGFLEANARPTLIELGRTLGNFTKGLAELWMAFDPLTDQFSAGLLEVSRGFAAWAEGLDQTEGFQEFMDYVSRNGPKVWETLGAVGNALVEIVEAAAPVGEATLPVIEALADAIATIADSPLGPTVIALASITSALGRIKALSTAASGGAIGGLFGMTAWSGVAKQAKDLPAAISGFNAYNTAVGRASTSVAGAVKVNERLSTSLRSAAKVAGGAGGLAFVMSDLDSKMGLTNTAMLAMAGSLAGPWGAAIGGGIGLVMDFAAAGDSATEKLEAMAAAVAAAGTTDLRGQFLTAYSSSNLVEDKKSAEAADKVWAAYERNKAAAQEATLAEAGLADAMRDSSNETRDSTVAMLDNIRAKNQAADASSSIFDAETNYIRALKAAEEQGKKNNAGIHGTSEAVLENRDTLSQLADAWNKQADAGGMTEKQLVKAKQKFIDAAVAMGATREESAALAEEWYHFPSLTPKVNVNLDQAFTQIDKLKQYLKGIKDEEVRINVRRAIESGGGRGHQTESAMGNIFMAYGAGGIENHIAQIGDGRMSRVWNEPETKGEAYIPLADDWRRPRAEEIWLETGRLLGMQAFASGAFLGASSAAAPASTLIELGALTGHLTITNWETGEARFQMIAANEADRAITSAERSAAGTRQTPGVRR